MTDAPYRVLIVDDEPKPERLVARQLSRRGVPTVAVHPDELTQAMVQQADLVVLDEYLKKWPGRDDRPLPLALRPRDGLAVAGILRSSLETRTQEQEDPLTAETPARVVAFVIRTSDYQRLAAGLPPRPGQHLIAAERDVEWVMPKQEEEDSGLPPVIERLAAIADAVRELPHQWPDHTSLVDRARSWLDLDAQPFADVAARHIEDCHPPLHAVAQRWAGRSFLRWFLHRILPYPCFLLDAAHVAARLRIGVDDLLTISASKSPLGTALTQASYTGQLATFHGPRWWRAGIDHLMLELGGGGWPHAAELSAAIAREHGTPIAAIEPLDPVVVLDAGYQSQPEAVSAKDALRIQPDSWPPYADDAWARIEDATNDPSIAAIVVKADRWQLPEPLHESD